MALNLSGAAAGASTGAQFGGMFGPTGATVGGILGGVTGLFGFGGSDASQAQTIVDPYAPYRAEAAAQLHALVNDPSSVTTLPGFEFMQSRGQQGVERAMSARGLSMSTNELDALKQKDQELAYQMYTDQFNKLSKLAGTEFSPGTGGSAYLTQETANQQANMQGLGGLDTIFKQLTNASTGVTPTNNVATTPDSWDVNKTLQTAATASM